MKKLVAFMLTIAFVLCIPFAAYADVVTVNSEAELKAALEAGGEFVLGSDFAVANKLTVPAGVTAVLDLNGKTVSMEDSSGTSAALILNNGTLTIKDSVGGGKLTFHSTTPSASNSYATNTITNAGSLTVLSGALENTTTGGASYAIDTAWTASGTTVSLTISGGTIVSQKIAVRLCAYGGVSYDVKINGDPSITGQYAFQISQYSGSTTDVDLTIEGGTFTTTSADYPYAIAASSMKAMGDSTLNINGGVFNGYVYFKSTDYEDAKIDISGGTFNDDVYVYGNPEEENLSVSGGTFNGDNGIYADSEDDIGFITGGTFTAEDNYASYYLAEGTYTVTYEADGKIIAYVNVKSGENVENVPEVPKKEGYNGKWDNDGKAITGNLTIKAVYTEVVPATGDDSGVMLWAALLLMSTAVLIVLKKSVKA